MKTTYSALTLLNLTNLVDALNIQSTNELENQDMCADDFLETLGASLSSRKSKKYKKSKKCKKPEDNCNRCDIIMAKGYTGMFTSSCLNIPYNYDSKTEL